MPTRPARTSHRAAVSAAGGWGWRPNGWAAGGGFRAERLGLGRWAQNRTDATGADIPQSSVSAAGGWGWRPNGWAAGHSADATGADIPQSCSERGRWLGLGIGWLRAEGLGLGLGVWAQCLGFVWFSDWLGLPF